MTAEEALENLVHAVKHATKKDVLAAVEEAEKIIGVVPGEPARKAEAKAKAEKAAKAKAGKEG